MDYKDVIAIGSDHFNTLWLVRSLGMAGFSPICIIVGAKNNKSFVGKSRYCYRCYALSEEKELIPLLLDLKLNKKTVVLASSDSVAEILDRNYDVLNKKYHLCNCGNKQNGIVSWMDKNRQLVIAKECGLSLPYSKAVNLLEDYDIDDIKYPALIKPEVSSEASKHTFRICNDKKELESVLKEMKVTCHRVMIQEYINHVNEYLMYGVCVGNDVIIPGGDYKELTCTDTNNMGMHVFGYVSSNHPKQFPDIERVKDFVRKTQYQGLFSVEVMITKDHYYFLEINMRNDGTSYLTTQAGVNIPAIWTAYCYGFDWQKYPITFKREKTYGLNEMNYIKYGIKKTGIVGTIRNMIRAKAFSLYKSDDIKPLIYKIIYH